MKVPIKNFKYNKFLNDGLQAILLNAPDIIRNLNEYDNYYFCALLYDFSDIKFKIYKNIKENNLSFSLLDELPKLNEENIIYIKNFSYCFNKLLPLEATIYSLLFREYGTSIQNKLSIIYMDHEDKDNNEKYMKFFLQDKNLLDLLYSFIPNIYYKYGNDYWNRASTYGLGTELFIYYIFFHQYFTEEMYNILITKLVHFYHANKEHPILNIMRQYINTCFPYDYSNEFNSKLLLLNLK